MAPKRTSPVTAQSGGLVCRKRKLKNFYDPKTAGGCGVALILSCGRLFGVCKYCLHEALLNDLSIRPWNGVLSILSPWRGVVAEIWCIPNPHEVTEVLNYELCIVEICLDIVSKKYIT
ncbi:hypothetical protein EH203_18160 [Pectobacterium carotovorum subsp. carotovorum]|nr:hypothetical protein EH203_18160 [Pectobacterium carotovorum subsp. carotovorum]